MRRGIVLWEHRVAANRRWPARTRGTGKSRGGKNPVPGDGKPDRGKEEQVRHGGDDWDHGGGDGAWYWPSDRARPGRGHEKLAGGLESSCAKQAMAMGLGSKEQAAGPDTAARSKWGLWSSIDVRSRQRSLVACSWWSLPGSVACSLRLPSPVGPTCSRRPVPGPATCSLLWSPTITVFSARLLPSPAACFSWPLPSPALPLG